MPFKDDVPDEGGISTFSQGVLDAVNKSRHEVLGIAYEEYAQGRILKIDTIVPPTLELLPHHDLTLKASRDPETNECPQNKCVVFKGESSLFDRFIDFAMALVKGKDAVGGFKAPSEIRFPSTGLKEGLSYEEFAKRVEVVEYVMWVEDVEDDEEELNSAVLESPQSISERRRSAEEMETTNTEMTTNSTPPAQQTPPKQMSPASGSSSSLSPPPEYLTTPPSMKRCTIRSEARTNTESDSPPTGKPNPKPPSPTPPSRNRRRRSGRR
ncbi:hypothetical protein EDB81DRAFT_946689 [Dactylonectria macrodidyma]|uniref:Uncharacterized protein n=1 Tax=Dactylonectria macrodidyma TaxID=307937 RepID=A0A9P9J7N1_9HYPO|nr:hypothetical protein EDB81DRAFT_946689 [Dactylonectria macrodidyma]